MRKDLHVVEVGHSSIDAALVEELVFPKAEVAEHDSWFYGNLIARVSYLEPLDINGIGVCAAHPYACSCLSRSSESRRIACDRISAHRKLAHRGSAAHCAIGADEGAYVPDFPLAFSHIRHVSVGGDNQLHMAFVLKRVGQISNVVRAVIVESVVAEVIDQAGLLRH